MPNGAQVHLAVNHLAVVGVLIGILVILAGFVSKQILIRKTGLSIFVFAALTLPLAYFSGEPAESVVEHKPLVTEFYIHNHEVAAEFGFIFIGILAAVSVAALLLERFKKEKYEPKITQAAVMISIVTLAILLKTAHLGGMIRHDELRGNENAETLK